MAKCTLSLMLFVEYAALKENNYSPIEILNSVVDSRNYSDLRHTHMGGCPVYILEYELASGKKLPK